MKLLTFLLLFLSIVTHDAYAQSSLRQITARIVDSETKKPIKGVKVTIKGTLVGAETNVSGFFQIPIDNIDTLLLQHSDYERSLIKVPEVDKFQIQMTKVTLNTNAPKMYFDEYGFSSDAANAKLYWIIVDIPGELKKSQVREYRIDNTPKQIWSFVHGDILTKDGSYVSYYSNGKKAEEGAHKDDIRIGKWLGWYKNGQLKQEGLYGKFKDPRRNYELINYWDSLGNILVSDRNGEQIIVGSGTIEYSTGLIKDGVKSETWKGFFKNGNIAFEEEYDNGQLIKGKSYDAEGKEYEYDAESSSSVKHFYESVSKSVRYPATARRLGIEGKVIVHFIVDTDGNISKSEVVKGIGGGCDEEVLRIMKSIGKWDWGKRRGQEYKPSKPQSMYMPIGFKLG